MSDIQVEMRVLMERELVAKFSSIPARTRRILRRRISSFVQALDQNVRAAIPMRKSPRWPSSIPALTQFIVGRVYSDNPNRVAGYVSVYAPGSPKEYPKAATLEYGSDRPRAVQDLSRGVWRRIRGSSRRIKARMGRPAHIRAYRFLRGPFSDMETQAVLVLEEGLAEMVAQEQA
ncbi:MAG: hypothetical protein ACP5P4_08055 [Steroidobacteraceae bacterium]